MKEKDHVGRWLWIGTGLGFLSMFGDQENWLLFVSFLALSFGWAVAKRVPPILGRAVLSLVLGFGMTLWIGMTQQVRIVREQQLERVEFGWPAQWLTEGLSYWSPSVGYEISADDPREADASEILLAPLVLDTLVIGTIFFAALSLGSALTKAQVSRAQEP